MFPSLTESLDFRINLLLCLFFCRKSGQMYHCVWRCLYPLSLTILFLTSQLALLKCFSPSRPLSVAAPGIQMLLELESHYEDTHQRVGEPFAEKAVVGSCQLRMRRRRRRRSRLPRLQNLNLSYRPAQIQLCNTHKLIEYKIKYLCDCTWTDVQPPWACWWTMCPVQSVYCRW